jgi:UDP-glucose 4-epimerase
MQMYAIRAVCLRYFNVYGIHQRYDAYGNVIPIFVTKLMADQPLTIYGDGDQTRDFVSVCDVAMANALALENEAIKGPFNVGTGVRITINELVCKLLCIHGRKVDILHAPERLGDVRHCTADIRRLRNEFGFSPSTDIQANLAEYYGWFRKNVYTQPCRTGAHK